MNERKTLTLKKPASSQSPRQEPKVKEEKPKKTFGKVIFTEQCDGLDKIILEYIENKTNIKFAFIDGSNVIGIIVERDRYGFRIDLGEENLMTIFKHALLFYQEIKCF